MTIFHIKQCSTCWSDIPSLGEVAETVHLSDEEFEEYLMELGYSFGEVEWVINLTEARQLVLEGVPLEEITDVLHRRKEY